MEDEIITTDEAARRLGVSRRRVQGLVADGAIPAVKLVGSWFIEEDAVDERLANTNKRGGRIGWL